MRQMLRKSAQFTRREQASAGYARRMPWIGWLCGLNFRFWRRADG